MSSGSEALSVGKVGSLEIETDMSRPENESSGLEVALRTVEVRLPDEPMIINGQHFGFEVHEDRLAEALKTINTEDMFSINRLSLTLDDSLPPLLREGKMWTKPVAYDLDSNSLNLMLPREVSDSQQSPTDLALIAQDSLARDIRSGQLQRIGAIKFQTRYRRTFLSAIPVGVMIGEGVGIATMDDSGNVLVEATTRGTFGAIIGAAAVLIAVGGKTGISERKYGGINQLYNAKGAKWADKHHSAIPSPEYDRPIISVVPFPTEALPEN